MSDVHFYLDELLSEECYCGEWKKKNYAFCYKCYFKLPADLRKRLYDKIGDGYEEAYDEAIKYLGD